jgi:hypothetical protein
MADYAIVTPTGDRPALFARCLQMVATQSIRPAQWVIVDDGATPLADRIDLPDWATYVRRPPQPADPPHTLSVNVLAALDHVTRDRVLVFEDDDWYAPLYAEYLLPFLDGADLVGLSEIRYYHLRAGRWVSSVQPRHTAFAQSAFRRGHAWDHLAAVCRTGFPEIREKGVLDRHWWTTFEGRSELIVDHPCLHLGFKGGFGRAGRALGHDAAEPAYRPDPDGAYLTATIGADALHYRRWQRRYPKPYAVYTVQGQDGALPDLSGRSLRHVDLYAFTDRPLPPGSPWEAIPLVSGAEDEARRADRPRMLPHLFFPDYEWSVWLDPRIPPEGEPEIWIAQAIEQSAPLAAPGGPAGEGWPLDAAALVRRHDDPAVAGTFTAWWTDGLGGDIAEDLRRAGLRPLALRPAG